MTASARKESLRRAAAVRGRGARFWRPKNLNFSRFQRHREGGSGEFSGEQNDCVNIFFCKTYFLLHGH